MSKARARKYRRLLSKMRTVNGYNTKVMNELNGINNLMNDILSVNDMPFHCELINSLNRAVQDNKDIICYNSIIPDIKEDIENEEDDDD